MDGREKRQEVESGQEAWEGATKGTGTGNSRVTGAPIRPRLSATPTKKAAEKRRRVFLDKHSSDHRTDGSTKACALPGVRLDALQIHMCRMCRPLAAENAFSRSVLGS